MKTNQEYGYSKTVGHSYEAAIAVVTEELKKEGFGVRGWGWS